MLKVIGRVLLYISIIIVLIALGLYWGQNSPNSTRKITLFLNSIRSLEIFEKRNWNDEFELVKIVSSSDQQIQNAYFYKTKSSGKAPLLVSLHTWSGDYAQLDSLSTLCLSKDINYIHPDFRGPNNTPEACCSEKAISDIDDAISYAMRNANVDSSKIFIIGASGGGYACLSSLMKSKHQIATFSSWVPITNLEKWFWESKITDNGYASDILNCTSSKNSRLNNTIARQRSPIFWKTPLEKLENSNVFIYTGINDGINGSVSISHSIDFYNKLLSDSKVIDSSKYVSQKEKLNLLEFRKPLGNYGIISNRKICLIKKYRNIKLVIFDGKHEMLTKYAFDELLK